MDEGAICVVMQGTSILWFKRDLRIHDHPALARAAARGPVLPLYIVEPEYWTLPDTSARQWAFIAESLADLRAALAARGQPLVVRSGDAVEVLRGLSAAHGITRIVSHEETGNLWTFARDRRVAEWARGAGIDWEELPQSGVVRGLRGRDGWAARRDAFVAADPALAPDALPPIPDIAPGPIPTAAQLRLAAESCPHRQTGGRAQGLATLESFLDMRGRDYRREMSSPLSGERGCSRLSPHLALGTLSGREVAQAVAPARAAHRGEKGWGASLKSFESRLAWRDHFMQKLEDAPHIETQCLHSAFEDLRPRTPDSARLAAWERGETGLPFVDACMRYLAATGWLNFRMRSMLTAVASYHLWLDWRATGPHLARMFTDYEPGIHWSQMQMQSGTTGMNALRMYNPVKQGFDQDPEGVFTRRWVPELADVPDHCLQEPWKWERAGTLLGRRYPEPVVDVATAARAARAALREARSRADFRDESRRLVARHGSRKGRGPRRPTDRAQMSFDL